MAQRPYFTDEILFNRVEILRGLFSDHLSPESAASEIAKVSLYPKENIGLTWAAIIVAARTCPEYHEKLVDLLLELAKLPLAKDEHGEEIKTWGGRIWEDLPQLGAEFNSEWNSFGVPEDEQERQQATVYFININAFTARLKIIGNHLFQGYDMFGLWTMRAALEAEYSSERDPPDVFIPAAEAWISVAGTKMYQWDKEFEYGGRYGDPGRGGRLWNGRHGFCQRRWCLWRRRFADFAESEELSDDLRRIASHAEARMDEIEAEADD